MCSRGILIPAGKMGRQHCQTPFGDRELGPKAVSPKGILQHSELTCSPLLDAETPPHSLPFDSPLPPSSQSFPLPCADSFKANTLQTFPAWRPNTSSLLAVLWFPHLPPLCSLATYHELPTFLSIPPAQPLLKALPGAPELQRGGCCCGRAGFAVPSTGMELAELLCFSAGIALGSSLP